MSEQMCKKTQALEYCEAFMKYCRHIIPCGFEDECTCGLDRLIELAREKFGSAVTCGAQPLGTSRWAGMWNGFPAVALSYHGGATLLYFDKEWKKVAFPSFAELCDSLDIER